MNMNDVKNLYSTMCDIISEFLLLAAEVKEAAGLMSLLSECADEDGLADNPTVSSMRAAVLYLGRISCDFSRLDDPAENLIKQFHDYLAGGNSAVREGV